MINIFGIKLHGYGLMIALGILVAWEIAIRFGKVQKKVIEEVATGLIVSGIFGARLYHVIDWWKYYSHDWVKILYLWNGGLGIWGAIVGGLTYLYFYAKYKKLNYWHLCDSITLGLPVAQAIGRVGNFINGELYGKNGEPLFAWEGGLNILLFVALMYVSGFRITCPQLLKHSFCRRESGMTRRTDSNGYKINDGVITGSYLIGYGVIRIFLENFRPNDIIWRLAGVPVAIWFGTVAIITGLGIIFFQKK